MIIYHIATKRSGHTWVGRMIKSWLPDAKYHDLENAPPARAVTPVNDGFMVFQLRDFLNWFASYYTHQNKHNGYKIVKHYQNMMQVFYHPNRLSDNTVRVYYDDFFCQKSYRESICNQLGGIYTERELDGVKNNGNGSSFDGMSYDGNAQEMDVLYRYQQVDPKIFTRIFTRFPIIYQMYKKTCTDPEKLRLCNVR